MGRRVGWRHSPEIQEQEGNAGFLELFLFACDGCRYLGPPCCYFLLTWVPVRLKEGEGGGEPWGTPAGCVRECGQGCEWTDWKKVCCVLCPLACHGVLGSSQEKVKSAGCTRATNLE